MTGQPLQLKQRRQRLLLLRSRHARLQRRNAKLREPLPFDGDSVDDGQQEELDSSKSAGHFDQSER